MTLHEGTYMVSKVWCRAALILPAKFLENTMVKAKSKMPEKWVKFWKKWMLKDWNFMYLVWQKLKYTATNSITSIYAPRNSTKRSQDTL